MNDSTACRIVLAFMNPTVFANVADAARRLGAGERVQEDFGFGVEEVETAREDRRKIAEHYNALKLTRSFWRAEMLARLRFLTELEECE